jgi:hypothetical protein
MGNAHSILVGKPVGKRPLKRHRHRWEDNIGMNLREIGWEVVDWMHLVQDRDHLWALVYAVMNLSVPYRRRRSYRHRFKNFSSPCV